MTGKPAHERTLNILGLTYCMDGSGFYRFGVPFTQLATASHHIVGLTNEGIPTEQITQADVVVMQRPAGKGGIRLVEQIIDAGKAIVFETDDDLFDADPSGLPHLHDDELVRTLKQCMRLAHVITTSTPYLAEQSRSFNEHVVPLNNCVDEQLLSASERWRADRDEKEGPDRPVVVGWEGGPTHLFDMRVHERTLTRIAAEHTPAQARLHFAGFDYRPFLVEAEHTCPTCYAHTPARDQRLRAEWSNWSDDIIGHYKAVAKFDIAIAPLADIPFNRSKSHLRALEAAACGVPTVATAGEAYGDFVRDGETGFLVSGPDEMADRVHQLITDHDLRKEMGAKAKDVAADWTIQKRWTEHEAAYELAYEVCRS